MRRLTWVIAGSALLAATAMGGAAQAQIKVGIILSLSGVVSSIGLPYERGIAAGIETINEVGGQKIEMIKLDDASDPATASKAARKLVEEDKVDILMGSAGTPASQAVYSVAAEEKVPMIILGNTFIAGERGDYEITVPQPAKLMVAADVEHMKKAGIHTVAYIGYSDGWGDDVYNALKETAEPAGIKVITNERYARADTSVNAQILKIIAAHPDTVLTGGSGSPGALPHLALYEHGWRGPEYSTHAVINKEFVRVGGAAVEGVIAPTGPVVVAEQLPESNPIRAASMKFRAAYEKIYNQPVPDAFAPYGYDGWLIMADSAKRALATGAKPGTPEFRKAMRDAMVTTTNLVGTHAVYNFHPGDRYGTDERSRVMVELEKGTWTLIP
jgi:branched-chain amino acid transport system substrate-binding protein